MNIAQQAYRDGQEYRKANRMKIAGEAQEKQAMDAFTHARLDFQYWQSYRNNWLAGYQFKEFETGQEARPQP